MTTTVTTQVKPGRLFIGGKWLEASTGKTFDTINPATGEVITTVAAGDIAEVNLASGAAREAFENGPWTRLNAADRGQILWRIGEGILKQRDEFARLETLDTGKPIGETTRIDVPMSADVFFYYAGWATKITGETVPVKGPYFNYTLREPVGVVACITPWNFPLLIASRKIAAALAAGNTVIHKPASLSPLTALKLAEVCQEAGLPDGVFNVLTGPGTSVGLGLVRHPEVDAIAFTGETATGQQIMRQAADTVKRLALELGGKSPNIVLADADLDSAVRGAVGGIFYNKGEVCTAGSRLFLDRSIHDAFMEKLLERTRKMLPGDPLDPKTRLGPLISQTQLEKVEGYVEVGQKEGAQLVAGGQRAGVGDLKGYFYLPTVFDQVDNRMRIAREEIFGPVLATIRFEEVEEVVKLANDTFYGLAAAVWTRDIKKAHQVARQLRAGTVWINSYNNYDAASPYGGYKQSGYGRESGREALEHFTQVKSVWVDLSG